MKNKQACCKEVTKRKKSKKMCLKIALIYGSIQRLNELIYDSASRYLATINTQKMLAGIITKLIHKELYHKNL